MGVPTSDASEVGENDAHLEELGNLIFLPG